MEAKTNAIKTNIGIFTETHLREGETSSRWIFEGDTILMLANKAAEKFSDGILKEGKIYTFEEVYKQNVYYPQTNNIDYHNSILIEKETGFVATLCTNSSEFFIYCPTLEEYSLEDNFGVSSWEEFETPIHPEEGEEPEELKD